MSRLVRFVAASLLLFVPSLAEANCGSGTCSVGAFGTGGTSSGGKAQGFYDKFPSTMFPGESFTNSGNFDAGRLNITGGVGSTTALSARKVFGDARKEFLAIGPASVQLTTFLATTRPSYALATITSIVWCGGFRYDFDIVKVPAFDAAGQPVHERGGLATAG